MKLKDLVYEATHAKDAEIDSFIEHIGNPSYKINLDGTLDITGDVSMSGEYQAEWPRIRYIDGGFTWYFIPEDYNPFEHMPKWVRGDVEIPIGKREIKSSQLPRSHGGAGVLYLTSAVEGKSFISLDDDTLFSYSKYISDAGICDGYEFIPAQWNTQNAILIVADNDLSTLSTSIECKYFSLTTDTPAAMKGIHKKIKSINSSGPVHFIVEDKSPLLGLLKICKGQDLWTTILGQSNNSRENQQLRRVMNKLALENLDSLDAQEQMIDAGLGRFAKL